MTMDSTVSLAEMRLAFEANDRNKVLEIYEKIDGSIKGSLRLEATCLAARALAGEKQRRAARELLKRVASRTYSKAIHYDHLVRAYLAVKDYNAAGQACLNADELLKEAKAKDAA